VQLSLIAITSRWGWREARPILKSGVDALDDLIARQHPAIQKLKVGAILAQTEVADMQVSAFTTGIYWANLDHLLIHVMGFAAASGEVEDL
jgi:hypothetical protein